MNTAIVLTGIAIVIFLGVLVLLVAIEEWFSE